MALAPVIMPFMWGEGGARMTPEEVARQRKVLDALAGRSDTSPVGHWTQGLARMTDALGDVLKERRVNAAETQNRDASRSNIQNMIQALVGGGGGEQFPPAPGVTSARPGTPAYADQRVASAHGADEIRHGLLQRGLPPHVAEAFVHNFMDESGLDPGINEREPLVPGSRGGFGLYQLTGPRRVAYEQFASQRGVDPADVDAQLDWLMHELQGPESRAAQNILSAPDTATAAQAIVNDFLRPAANHRQARANRYASLASPEGMPATDAVNAFAGGEPAPPLGAPQEVPQLQVAQALTGQQMAFPEAAGGAGNMQAPGGGMGGGINPHIIEALSSPYASEQERQIAGLLLNQHMEQQAAQQAQQQRMTAAQQAGIDPNFAGDEELWKRATEQRFRDDRTGDIKEFEYGQNTPEFYDHAERMARARANQTNVNIPGQPNIGPIPQGWQAIQDPESGGWSMSRVPGGPAEAEQQDAERQREAARTNAVNYARTVTQDIGIADDYLSQIEGMAAEDGVIGANLRNTRASIAGTPENNMKSFVDSALSNVTLDTMNRMRESSPAGATGFGNMSERQMEVIRGVLGNWKPSLPVEDQRMILHRLGNFYLDVQFGSEQERQEAVRDGRMTQIESDAIQELYYPETRDVRGRRIDTNKPISEMTDEELEALANGDR